MALGPTLPLVARIPIAPLLLISQWEQVGDDTYLLILDNSSITDPIGQITDASRQPFSRMDRVGEILCVRATYDGTPVTTTPIIKVFGRTRLADNTVDRWQILVNRAGTASVEIVCNATTDLVVSNLRISRLDPTANCFETRGCNEFLIGVERALVATLPPTGFGYLHVKFV